MDTSDGATTFALNELNQVIREYSLFRSVLLVMQRLRVYHPDATEEQLYTFVEFEANASLGFAPSDVDSVRFFQEHGQWRARLRFNVIGLVGANSPLPAFYAEQALSDGAGQLTRDFLNLFHDRLQRLLLPIWHKYRYRAGFREGAKDRFSQLLFAFVGLGGSAIRDTHQLNWNRLLPYLGLLSLRAHSAALIEAVLRYYFKHAELFIEQCTERWVVIPPAQRIALGRANNQLSNNAVVGERVRDISGKFRVHIRQLDWQRFHDFLPIGSGYTPLCALVRFAQRDPLAYDIQLQLRHEEIRELRIGAQNRCLLGWTSWLGHERADGLVTLGSSTH